MVNEFLGRSVKFQPVSTGFAIHGVKAIGIEFGGEAVDISDNDDDGYPRFLAGEVTNKGITLTLSGIVGFEEDFFDAIFEGHGHVDLTNYKLSFDSLSKTVSGDWKLKVSFETEGETAASYTATAATNGPWVFDEDSTD